MLNNMTFVTTAKGSFSSGIIVSIIVVNNVYPLFTGHFPVASSSASLLSTTFTHCLRVIFQWHRRQHHCCQQCLPTVFRVIFQWHRRQHHCCQQCLPTVYGSFSSGIVVSIIVVNNVYPLFTGHFPVASSSASLLSTTFTHCLRVIFQWHRRQHHCCQQRLPTV